MVHGQSLSLVRTQDNRRVRCSIVPDRCVAGTSAPVEHAPGEVLNYALNLWIISASNNSSAALFGLETELLKGPHQLLKTASICTKVVFVNVGDDTDIGMELQERAVRFVGF